MSLKYIPFEINSTYACGIYQFGAHSLVNHFHWSNILSVIRSTVFLSLYLTHLLNIIHLLFFDEVVSSNIQFHYPSATQIYLDCLFTIILPSHKTLLTRINILFFLCLAQFLVWMLRVLVIYTLFDINDINFQQCQITMLILVD